MMTREEARAELIQFLCGNEDDYNLDDILDYMKIESGYCSPYEFGFKSVNDIPPTSNGGEGDIEFAWGILKAQKEYGPIDSGKITAELVDYMGDYADDFDVKGIVNEIEMDYGWIRDIGDIDDLDEILRRYDVSGK